MSEPVEIPPERLSPEALESVIDDYVLREGTDYGHADVPIETKRERVRAELAAGTAVITFDPETESCTIVSRD
jgi:uncharacterized protein YheU (UPF0270 family)